MAEPTPPKSPTQGDLPQHSSNEEAVRTTGEGYEATGQATAGQELALVPPEPEPPKCMFVQPCTTGSTLRKAISHIFGRNKLCTKSIPANIWVHYCRKHYQRSRYRNATDYALRQVDLVLVQVKKVQEWSDDNVKYNRRGDGVLKHWTLQARKREAKRILETESRKRRYTEDENDDDDENGSGTAIPSWLQPRLNQDYDTPRMLEIVDEIKDHMNRGDITQIPDIEVLPEIMTDGNESRPKSTTRRASNATGHRHTKSEIYRTPPSMSAYNRLGSYSVPDQKRMRSGASSFMPIHNLAHRPVMAMNQSYPYSMPQNNGFATIAENQADHGFWTNGYGPNSVLPQPVPQRGSSMPEQSNNTNLQQPYALQGGRPSHSRSMSENPAMRSTGYGTSDFRFPPQAVNNYGQQPQQDMFGNLNMGNGHNAQPYSYQAPTPQGYANPYGMNTRDGQENPFGNPYYTQQPQDWAGPRGQHSRVQSTPAIHQQQASSIPGGPPPMPAVTGAQGMLPSMNSMGGHQQMYHPGQQGYGDFQQGRF